MVRVLSLGAGVQSSTLALLASELPKKYRPAFAIFADTQAEPKSVYTWLEYLKSNVSFPIYTVSKGNLSELACNVRVSKKTKQTYIKHIVPCFVKRIDGSNGMLQRQCTLDFKIEPIKRAIKKLIPKEKRTVEMWIGISKDECHRMKPSKDTWIINYYPLVNLGKSRQDCLDWMKSRGHPIPPRSSCRFCPYHNDNEWRRLKYEEPEEFQKAVEWERKYQESVKQIERLDGVPYLHAKRIPLDEIEFDNCGPINNFVNECEGMCGV